MRAVYLIIVHEILGLHILGIEVFCWLNIHLLFAVFWNFRLGNWLGLLEDVSVKSKERPSDWYIVFNYECAICFSKRKIWIDFMEPILFFISAGHYSQTMRNHRIIKMLIVNNNYFVYVSVVNYLNAVKVLFE